MEFKKINPHTISKRGRVQNYISYFMNDPSTAVEIVDWQDEYKNGDCLLKSYRLAIKSLSLSDEVRVMKRGQHYFLVKIKEVK